MLRKPEDRKEWQNDILPSIEETSEPIIAKVKGEKIVEPILKAVTKNEVKEEETPVEKKVATKKPVAKKPSAKKTTKKPIEKMEV